MGAIMKIAVCVKPIKTELVFPNEGRNEAYVINPYDLHAFEKAIELKAMAGCELICVSMGAIGTQYLLTKMIAMGADDALLLCDMAFAGSDTVATSYVLSRAIRSIGGVDLVICGDRSIDGETGQVVYGLSEELGYQCIGRAERFLSAEGELVVAEQRSQDMINQIRFSLPAVVSFCEFSLKTPEISLVALKKARRKGIKVLEHGDIDADRTKCGLFGSKTKVLNIKSDLLKKGAGFVEGSTFDKVSVILDVIMDRKPQLNT